MSRQVRMRIALLDVDVAEDVLKANPDLASYIEIVTIQAPAAKGQQNNAGSVAAIRMGNNILTRHTHMVQDLDTLPITTTTPSQWSPHNALDDVCVCGHSRGRHAAAGAHQCLYFDEGLSCLCGRYEYDTLSGG